MNPGALTLETGTSCRLEVHGLAGVTVVHPAVLLRGLVKG